MSAERYSSNVSAFGRDLASKLESSSVTILGNNSVAQSAIYCLIGLGVGEIRHMTTTDKLHCGILKALSDSIFPGCDSLSESMAYVAPQIKYSQTPLINNSNNGCEGACFDSDQFNFSAPNEGAYGVVGGLITGTLLADEFRKNVGLVSTYEQTLSDSDDSINVNLASILHRRASHISERKFNRVLVIGAGGLGTYCTYVLSARAVPEIVLCEPDVVEEKNLNRQLFYTGRVGESKAKVLAERLSTSGSKIIPRCELFSEDFNSRGNLDAIFCCTDTLESRICASDYAQQHKIPLVEGACTATMGSITTYFPGFAKTVSQQRDLLELLRLKNIDSEKKSRDTSEQDITSCARVSNPSVISPNVIIGALQAIALDKKYDSTGNLIDSYPQVYLNLLRNSKFTHGGL